MHDVLVVDDDRLILRSLRRTLAAQGFKVTTACGSAEALRRVKGARFDVALVDYDMPGADGLTLLSLIRENQPACIRMLMTGSSDFPMIVDAVNRGAVMRVIPKPFEPSLVLRHLNEAWATVRRMASVREAQLRAVEAVERSMLDACIGQGHLRLAIQPILKAGGERGVFGYECLLRSTHPVLDGPLSVLQVAERHGRMTLVGNEVFRLAGEILDSLPMDQVLFINLHPDQLAEPAAMEAGLACLEGRGHRCALEITERSRLQGIPDWERTIHALQERGFRIAVDDLGAGYNSLAVLADLQPSFVKLDMSIVRNVDSEPRKQRLVDLLVRFSEATGSMVVGEGIETAAELETLEQFGIHLLQGYHLGRPAIFHPEDHMRMAG